MVGLHNNYVGLYGIGYVIGLNRPKQRRQVYNESKDRDKVYTFRK